MPGEEAGDDMFAMSGDTLLDNTLGMTTEEFTAYFKREWMKEAVEIQMPRGGAGTMEAFRLNAGSSIAGTVVEDEERTTAGVSIADKSLWTIEDGTLGRLGIPREDDDSNKSIKPGDPNMEIELPAGGLDRIYNANRDQPGKSFGEDDGSGLDPVQIDVEEVSNPGGGSLPSENGTSAQKKTHSWKKTTNMPSLATSTNSVRKMTGMKAMAKAMLL